MSQKTNYSFSIQTLPKRSFPKFLSNKNEPWERPILESPDEASKELEAEMLLSWYRQKRVLRRYARELRQHHV